MGRKALPKDKKAVQITITVDKETFENVQKYAELENLPVSRFISRILKRYFEMK